MKRKTGISILTVTALLMVTTAAIAISSDPTMPSSRGNRGQYRRTWDINSGNLLITGNVSGGKEFRGLVPYQSTLETGGRSSSFNTLDSFRRATTWTSDRSPGLTQPYFESSKVGSRLYLDKPIDSSIFDKQTGVPVFKTALPNIDELSALYKQPEITTPAPRVSPISRDFAELKRIVDYQAKWGLEEKEAKPLPTVDPAAKTFEPLEEPKVVPDALTPAEPVDPTKVRLKPKEAEAKEDIFEQMQKSVDQIMELRAKQAEEKAAAEEGKEPAEEGAEEKPETEGDLRKVTLQETLALEGSGLRAKHKTFAAYEKDEFNKYMAAAEALMHEGKYYRAADAYTLAAIYDSQNPLCYAGKSHALFAAGQYMSSSYFLGRAISLFPEYVNLNIDLVAMVGDADALDTRIAEITEWQQRSGSGELAFLLAYVYSQTDRLENADKAIKTALEIMPENAAFITLGKAIEEKIAAGQE